MLDPLALLGRAHDTGRRAGRAALLEPRQVAHRDARALRDLLPAQTGRASCAAVMWRREPVAPGTQARSEVVHRREGSPDRAIVGSRRGPQAGGMTTTLITGANKGLGYETARRLLSAGHEVWVGARDEARGRDAASSLGARFVALDVTDDASVAAAADFVGSLDVLVNNAGVVGNRVPVAETGPTTSGSSTRPTCSARCASSKPSAAPWSAPRTQSWSTSQAAWARSRG